MINKDKLLKLIRQPSSWRGLIYSIGGIGALIHKDFFVYIVPISLAIAGAVGMFFDDEIGQAAQKGAEDAINDIKKHI